MFNDKFLLTQLVLEEKKTETRRNQTLTLHKKKGKGGNWVEIFPTKIYLEEGKWKVEYDNLVFSLPKANYPKYEIGEEVAIAQSYCDCGGLNEDGVPRWDVISKTVGATNAGWNNKMFVRPELMPHRVRITDVRAERLQDISEADCLAEGIIKGTVGFNNTHLMDAYYVPSLPLEPYCTAREAYAELIDRISGEGTWVRNPWVWAYSFELINGELRNL